MSNEPFLQIRDKMVERVKRTLAYCEGVDRETFMRQTMLQEACVFNVLQVGELAAKAIERGYDQVAADIPWRQMRGMRNRIVHDYEGVRLDTVWDAIQSDFPALLGILEGNHQA